MLENGVGKKEGKVATGVKMFQLTKMRRFHTSLPSRQQCDYRVWKVLADMSLPSRWECYHLDGNITSVEGGKFPETDGKVYN